MDSRQRVLLTLDHREADRVPVDYWASSQFTTRLQAHLGAANQEELLRLLGVDSRYVQGPSLAGLELRQREDGLVEDLWGVGRRTVTVDGPHYSWTYKEVAVSPLAGVTTVAEVDGYPRWPSPDWWDYSHVAEECARHPGYAVVLAGDRLDRTCQLKTACYLRGMEQFLIDLVLDPALAEAILRHIVEYHLEYGRRVFEAAQGRADIFMMGDDFGTQTGLMVSRDLWRRYFRAGFRQFIDLAHKYGLKVMHHTCGAVRELIPEFIDAGLDILQSLQPRAAGMDLAELKREFGRHICFHGSIDIQQTLPYGTPREIEAEVAARMAAGKPGGGFIISTAHDILPDVSLANVIALFESYRKYGNYVAVADRVAGQA